MINWIKRKDKNPIKEGKYLVFCEAPAWDSSWVALAIFKAGIFNPIFNDTYTHDLRVTYWAEINEPDK